MRPSLAGPLCLLFLAAACGGDDGGDAERGRGSDACRDFQDAACDFAVDRCGVTARATCDRMFQSLACKSDEQASACANALNDASCGVASAECNLDLLIDPQPAVDACQQLVTVVCDHAIDCGQFATVEECSAQNAAAGLRCDGALGVTLTYEECLSMLEGLSCGAALPSTCSGVILVQPPGL